MSAYMLSSIHPPAEVSFSNRQNESHKDPYGEDDDSSSISSASFSPPAPISDADDNETTMGMPVIPDTQVHNGSSSVNNDSDMVLSKFRRRRAEVNTLSRKDSHSASFRRKQAEDLSSAPLARSNGSSPLSWKSATAKGTWGTTSQSSRHSLKPLRRQLLPAWSSPPPPPPPERAQVTPPHEIPTRHSDPLIQYASSATTSRRSPAPVVLRHHCTAVVSADLPVEEIEAELLDFPSTNEFWQITQAPTDEVWSSDDHDPHEPFDYQAEDDEDSQGPGVIHVAPVTVDNARRYDSNGESQFTLSRSGVSENESGPPLGEVDVSEIQDIQDEPGRLPTHATSALVLTTPDPSRRSRKTRSYGTMQSLEKKANVNTKPAQRNHQRSNRTRGLSRRNQGQHQTITDVRTLLSSNKTISPNQEEKVQESGLEPLPSCHIDEEPGVILLRTHRASSENDLLRLGSADTTVLAMQEERHPLGTKAASSAKSLQTLSTLGDPDIAHDHTCKSQPEVGRKHSAPAPVEEVLSITGARSCPNSICEPSCLNAVSHIGLHDARESATEPGTKASQTKQSESVPHLARPTRTSPWKNALTQFSRQKTHYLESTNKPEVTLVTIEKSIESDAVIGQPMKSTDNAISPLEDDAKSAPSELMHSASTTSFERSVSLVTNVQIAGRSPSSMYADVVMDSRSTEDHNNDADQEGISGSIEIDGTLAEEPRKRIAFSALKLLQVSSDGSEREKIYNPVCDSNESSVNEGGKNSKHFHLETPLHSRLIENSRTTEVLKVVATPVHTVQQPDDGSENGSPGKPLCYSHHSPNETPGEDSELEPAATTKQYTQRVVEQTSTQRQYTPPTSLEQIEGSSENSHCSSTENTVRKSDGSSIQSKSAPNMGAEDANNLDFSREVSPSQTKLLEGNPIPDQSLQKTIDDSEIDCLCASAPQSPNETNMDAFQSNTTFSNSSVLGKVSSEEHLMRISMSVNETESTRNCLRSLDTARENVEELVTASETDARVLGLPNHTVEILEPPSTPVSKPPENALNIQTTLTTPLDEREELKPFLLAMANNDIGIPKGDCVLSLLDENPETTYNERVKEAVWRCRTMRQNCDTKWTREKILRKAGSPPRGRSSVPVDTDDARVVGGIRSALKTQRAAIEHLKFDELDDALALFEDIVATYSSHLEDIKSSSDLYQEGYTMELSAHFRSFMGPPLHNVGIVHLLRGDFQNALSYFEESSPSRVDGTDLGNPDYITSLARKAVCNCALQNLDDANRDLEFAVSHLQGNLRTMSDYRQLAECLNNIGCLSYRNGNIELAEAQFTEALECQAIVAQNSLYAGSKYSSHAASINVSVTEGNLGFLGLSKKDYDASVTLFEFAVHVRSGGLTETICLFALVSHHFALCF
jgi:tetratricopeptide (TPR) repeat protein